MKAALTEMLTLYFLLILLFQPVLHELYATRAHAVEMVLDLAVQKAAASEQGCFTAELVQEMKGILTTQFQIKEGDIRFSGTTSPVPRGEKIEGTLVVRSTPRWLFSSLFGAPDQDSGYIVRHAEQMSEALLRGQGG